MNFLFFLLCRFCSPHSPHVSAHDTTRHYQSRFDFYCSLDSCPPHLTSTLNWYSLVLGCDRVGPAGDCRIPFDAPLLSLLFLSRSRHCRPEEQKSPPSPSSLFHLSRSHVRRIVSDGKMERRRWMNDAKRHELLLRVTTERGVTLVTRHGCPDHMG